MQSLRCGLLAIVASLGLSACAAESVDVPSTDPAGDLEPEGLWGNSLHAAALAQNSLMANPIANLKMTTVPLSTASYADLSAPPELRNQLLYPPSREVMSYLVGCALDSTQTVAYTHPSTGINELWHGELGLCPSWNSGAASITCQEHVSACLVARVNGFGLRVELSMRGQASPSTALTLASSVATVDRNKLGDLVSSFATCASPTPGVARNCGYVTNQVGTCVPGEIVNVGAGAPPPLRCGDPVIGSSSGNTVLRVCSGIIGCDHGSPTLLGQNGGACSMLKPSVRITCPASGTFSVMSGPQTSGGAGLAAPDARSPSAVAYPGNEAGVFPWQEGAFYGNLWALESVNNLIHPGDNMVDGGGIFHPAVVIPLASGAVFTKMFACSGIYWTKQDAYMKDRVCAGAATNCAAKPVGACATSVTTPCPAINNCGTIHGIATAGDYDDCVGGGATWHNPITVYLNQPSDIEPDPNTGVSGSPWSPPAPICF